VQRIVRHMKLLASASAAVALATAVGGVGLSGASAASYKGTVKVSIVGDITGDLSVASVMQGALAYFDSVNAQGGVDGYKIVPKEYDTQSSPTTAVQAFRSAIAGKPDIILGGSFVAASGLPTLAKSGIPTVGDGTAPGWTGHKTLFPVLGDEATHISNVLFTVDKKYGGADKVALLGSDLYTADLKNLADHAKAAGVTLAMQDLTLPLVPTSAQLLTAAEQVKSSGAQGVVAIGVENLDELQIDLNQLGAKVSVVTTDLVAAPTKTQDGLIYSDPWADVYTTKDPGVTAFKAAMTKYGYGKLLATSAYAPLRYAQAALVVTALQAAGPPFSHSAVVKALSKVKNFTANGILPAVSFPSFQTVGDHCQTVLKLVNAKWVSETNGIDPFLCGGPSLPDAS